MLNTLDIPKDFKPRGCLSKPSNLEIILNEVGTDSRPQDISSKKARVYTILWPPRKIRPPPQIIFVKTLPPIFFNFFFWRS